MDKLKDHELLEAFYRAKELNCSPDFIQLLLEEMMKRNMVVEELAHPLPTQLAYKP